jgi:hypothetical protein
MAIGANGTVRFGAVRDSGMKGSAQICSAFAYLPFSPVGRPRKRTLRRLRRGSIRSRFSH